jgi:hypothetical protein
MRGRPGHPHRSGDCGSFTRADATRLGDASRTSYVDAVNVSGVAHAASETTAAAAGTEQNSTDFARLAGTLQSNFARFRY